MNINSDELREWLPTRHILMATDTKKKSTLYAIPHSEQGGIYYELLFYVAQNRETKKITRDLNEAVEVYNQL